MSRYRAAMLDTSVLIDFPTEVVTATTETAVVSAITVGELAYGLNRGDAVERAIRVSRFYNLLNSFEISPYTVEAAKLYGVLADLCLELGRNPRPRRMDLQIAATAAAERLPLITRNGKDFLGFERVLKVIAI